MPKVIASRKTDSWRFVGLARGHEQDEERGKLGRCQLLAVDVGAGQGRSQVVGGESGSAKNGGRSSERGLAKSA
jgi:hypothetical protein